MYDEQEPDYVPQSGTTGYIETSSEFITHGCGAQLLILSEQWAQTWSIMISQQVSTHPTWQVFCLKWRTWYTHWTPSTLANTSGLRQLCVVGVLLSAIPNRAELYQIEVIRVCTAYSEMIIRAHRSDRKWSYLEFVNFIFVHPVFWMFCGWFRHYQHYQREVM